MGFKSTITVLAAIIPVLVAAKPEQECKPAYDAVFEAFGDFEFGGDAEAGKQLPGLIEKCTIDCPKPFSDECLQFKDVDTSTLAEAPEGCKQAQDAMYLTYGDFEFGGDEKAGEALPGLVEECKQQCKGSDRLVADCEVYAGVSGIAVPTSAKPDKECKPAYDAVFEAFGDFEFGGDAEAGKQLPGLIEKCTIDCPKPFSDECLQFKDVDTSTLAEAPEGCKQAQDAMYLTYGDFEFGGDEKAGEALPGLVEECKQQCKGSERLVADCEVFEGVTEK